MINEKYEFKGEVRSPKIGEYFLSDGQMLKAFADFTEKRLPIVYPSNRVAAEVHILHSETKVN